MLSPTLSPNFSATTSVDSFNTESGIQSQHGRDSTTSNESIPSWDNVADTILRRRGNQLKRNTILKLDHFPSGTNTLLDVAIPGAPNFRSMAYHVYGVAQPTVDGLAKLMLHLTGACREYKTSFTWVSTREEPLVYVNGRPYVLRAHHDPRQNTATFRGMSASGLEDVEERLKKDVLSETKQFDGLLLVHNDGTLYPHFEKVEVVQTPREVFTSVVGLAYHRIPISTDQSPENNFFDRLLRIICQLDPKDPIIFNCGIGAVRTTLGTIIAQLIRRSQLDQQGKDIPNTEPSKVLLQGRWSAIVEKVRATSTTDPASLPDNLTEDWKRILLGNHYVIQSLYSALPHGVQVKHELDMLIDQASTVVHLREVIVEHLLSYIMSTANRADSHFLEKASLDLRRYFMLICFASFLQDRQHVSFASWIRSKKEIRSQYRHLRTKDPRQAHFKQLLDDSANRSFSRSDHVFQSHSASVLTSRRILKEDDWRNAHSITFEKAYSRGIMHRVAQPTVAHLQQMVHCLNKDMLWINLREEPILYISGVPYALRNSDFMLHNIRDFRGISGTSLEALEMRLKKDVVAEIEAHQGQLLLHREDSESQVRPEWRRVKQEDVLTFREIMDMMSQMLPVRYARVPITAEKVPEIKDFDELRTLLVHYDLSKTAIIMNCQSGRGRSKTGMVISALLRRWLMHSEQDDMEWDHSISPQRLNYEVISSLVRVLRNGQEAKQIVDDTIDRFGMEDHLRDIIHSTWRKTSFCLDTKKKRRLLKRGLIALERYFLLICFQAFLSSTSPAEDKSFLEWMRHHPEIKTISKDLRSKVDDVRFGLIVPFDEPGHDHPSAEMKIVRERSGQVLAHGTILKSDDFPGCQKKGLKETVGKAYNFRRVSIKDVRHAAKVGLPSHYSRLAADLEATDVGEPPFIGGCAMPSKEAIKSVLTKMGATPGSAHKVYWTCLREEPVLYINAKPYVLRSHHNPLRNLETTGITTERVEHMEVRMKKDVLHELGIFRGRLLLHDESVVENGGFELNENWQTVADHDVQTPAEMFASIQAEGYQVDYRRIATTDEQAPIPRVFDLLVQRQKEATGDADLLFNCQMGRGRTTTGMVTACLMSMVIDENCTLATIPAEEEVHGTSMASYDEYGLILNVVSVLRHGSLAKRLADHAINLCDHMQNLRMAVNVLKERLDALPPQPSQNRRTASEAVFHYLIRYFYLIVFASYLLETKAETTTFETWLTTHPEISNLIQLHARDFQ